MAIVEMNDQSFATEVETSTAGTVLVDFWAPWCAPCKMLAPILEEVDQEIGEQVTIAKLNVDQYPEVSNRLGVLRIPTLMVFKNGEMVSKMTGLQQKEQLIEWLREYM